VRLAAGRSRIGASGDPGRRRDESIDLRSLA